MSSITDLLYQSLGGTGTINDKLMKALSGDHQTGMTVSGLSRQLGPIPNFHVSPWPGGRIAVVIDDGGSELFTAGTGGCTGTPIEYARANGVPLTLAIPCVNARDAAAHADNSTMTHTEISQAFMNYGCEIASHSYNHSTTPKAGTEADTEIAGPLAFWRDLEDKTLAAGFSLMNTNGVRTVLGDVVIQVKSSSTADTNITATVTGYAKGSRAEESVTVTLDGTTEVAVESSATDSYWDYIWKIELSDSPIGTITLQKATPATIITIQAATAVTVASNANFSASGGSFTDSQHNVYYYRGKGTGTLTGVTLLTALPSGATLAATTVITDSVTGLTTTVSNPATIYQKTFCTVREAHTNPGIICRGFIQPGGWLDDERGYFHEFDRCENDLAKLIRANYEYSTAYLGAQLRDHPTPRHFAGRWGLSAASGGNHQELVDNASAPGTCVIVSMHANGTSGPALPTNFKDLIDAIVVARNADVCEAVTLSTLFDGLQLYTATYTPTYSFDNWASWAPGTGASAEAKGWGRTYGGNSTCTLITPNGSSGKCIRLYNPLNSNDVRCYTSFHSDPGRVYGVRFKARIGHDGDGANKDGDGNDLSLTAPVAMLIGFTDDKNLSYIYYPTALTLGNSGDWYQYKLCFGIPKWAVTTTISWYLQGTNAKYDCIELDDVTIERS
jgi:hypothetical protein